MQQKLNEPNVQQSRPDESRSRSLPLVLLLTLAACASGCATPKPEVQYVVQTVVADCPKPPEWPAELLAIKPKPPGYFLNQIEKGLFPPETKPNSSTEDSPSASQPDL